MPPTGAVAVALLAALPDGVVVAGGAATSADVAETAGTGTVISAIAPAEPGACNGMFASPSAAARPPHDTQPTIVQRATTPRDHIPETYHVARAKRARRE